MGWNKSYYPWSNTINPSNYRNVLIGLCPLSKISSMLISFFILDRSPYSHSALMVGWWCYNTRTEFIETLDSAPLMYLMRYFIPHVFGSFPSLPTAPHLPLPPSSSLSSSTASNTLAPARSSHSFSHHHLATHVPGLRTISLQRSRIGGVTMYCAAVLCLFSKYAPFSSNYASSIAVPSGCYSEISSSCCFG